jgi:hypothetical protein
LSFSDLDTLFNLPAFISYSLGSVIDSGSLSHNSNDLLAIFSAFSKDNSYLIGDRLDAYNIAVILGSMIGFYPRRSSLDIKNLLIKYTCLRINRLKLSNSHLDYDDDIPHTNFNRPLTPTNVGWGGNPFKYGFDEKLLKAVLFPYFVQRGELITITRDKDERREIMNSDNSEVKTYFKTELMFCDYYNNLLAYYE